MRLTIWRDLSTRMVLFFILATLLLETSCTPAKRTPPFHLVEINFPGVSVDQFLEFYAALSGRTVLQPPLPNEKITLKASSLTAEEATTLLNQTLKAHHLIAIPDGNRFLRVVPEARAEADTARAAKLKATPAKFPKSKGSAGDLANVDISFPNTYLTQAAEFYAALAGAGALEKNAAYWQAGQKTIKLKTVKPLTASEALYALDTLFAWNGLEVLPSSNNLVRLAVIH